MVTDQESTDHEAETSRAETPQDEALSTSPPETEGPAAARPRAAIVIGPLIIQSAATPLVGVVMLALGLAAGYLLRPALTPATPIPTPAPTVVVQATPVASSGLPPPISGSPTPNPTELAQRRALADNLASWTRHFKGNANAPVTIIEFSDYQ
jgi:hypothetical protein